MMIPLTTEMEWTPFLHELPRWRPPFKPVLLLAPHPDDETLGAGGLIAWQRGLGCEVTVVAVTDGENAYADTSGLGPVRRLEQEAALSRLGVDNSHIFRLQLPDSDVASHQTELIERVLPLVTGETHIVAPWPGDFHPDHESCGRAAAELARRTGAAMTWYFFWTWHRGTTETLRGLRLQCFPLDDELLRAKSEALQQHRSQLVRETGDPILPQDLLYPARRPFEVFAAA